MRLNTIQLTKVWTASRVWMRFDKKDSKGNLVYNKEGEVVQVFAKRGVRLESGEEQTKVYNGVPVTTQPGSICWMFPSKSGKTGGTVTRKAATYPTFSNAGRVTVMGKNGPKLTSDQKETMTSERFVDNNPQLWELLQQADMLLTQEEEARKAG